MTATASSERRADSTDELRETVVRLARIGACTSPSFSPDARQLAFVSDLGGLPQVWRVDATGGWPELVTTLEDQVRDVSWSPEGTWLALTAAPGGGLNSQIYLVRPDGSDLTRITEGGRTNNWLSRWSEDGRYVLYSSSRRTAEAMDPYAFEPVTGATRPISQGPGIAAATDVSPDGRVALVYRMTGRGDDDVHLVDLESGRDVLLTPHEPPANFEWSAFSADSGRVYLSSNEGRERTAFAVVDLDGFAPGRVETIAERDDAELEQFLLTPDRSTALLIWNVAGRSELELVDLASHRREPGPQLPAELVLGADFSADGGTIAFALSGSSAPADLWTLRLDDGLFTQVTRSPHAGVDLSQLARPELVTFAAHDGLELSGWLYRPDAAAPWPIVICFHGGPEAQERPRFDSTYQALLARGIGVLAPNIRGSAGFGKTFVNLDNGRLRFDAIKDVEACVAFAVASGADPARVGVTGGSYGGYMTMVSLTHYPELFAAGATICGVVNFETFFAHTEPWMSAISNTEYGDPETEVELLRDLSPIHKIDRVTAPTLVLHGANDTNVPVVEAEQVVERLRARDVPVEYVLFPDEGHGFRKRENKIEATVSVVSWFARHLGA
jgi:dipeptidyl aminopeptidase/acylaminoacyl peptidase